MSDTLDLVRAAVAAGQVRVSWHGLAELDADSISLDEVKDSAPSAILIEDYASAWIGPIVLALHRARDGRPFHVVWGFTRGTTSPAVLVTAYRRSRSVASIAPSLSSMLTVLPSKRTIPTNASLNCRDAETPQNRRPSWPSTTSVNSTAVILGLS